MRMKVKSPDDEAFSIAEAILDPSGKVVLKSRKRLTLSVENPTPSMVRDVEAAGSRVVVDRQFSADPIADAVSG